MPSSCKTEYVYSAALCHTGKTSQMHNVLFHLLVRTCAGAVIVHEPIAHERLNLYPVTIPGCTSNRTDRTFSTALIGLQSELCPNVRHGKCMGRLSLLICKNAI
jgi:hypothetical protein